MDIKNSLNIEYHLTEKSKVLNKILYELAMFTPNTDLKNKYYDENTKNELKKLFKEKMKIDD